jgi:hypothetical protein
MPTEKPNSAGGLVLRDQTYNVKVKQSKVGASLDPESVAIYLRKRADAYFDEVAIPTYTGLALALGFTSVGHWKDTVEHYYQMRSTGQGRWTSDMADRLVVWEIAQSRIQLHYEEAMQSGAIPPAVGKFVLEVLGFRPEPQRSPDEDRAKVAARAAQAGFQAAAKAFSGMDKGHRRALAQEIEGATVQ